MRSASTSNTGQQRKSLLSFWCSFLLNAEWAVGGQISFSSWWFFPPHFLKRWLSLLELFSNRFLSQRCDELSVKFPASQTSHVPSPNSSTVQSTDLHHTPCFSYTCWLNKCCVLCGRLWATPHSICTWNYRPQSFPGNRDVMYIDLFWLKLFQGHLRKFTGVF